MLKLPFFLAASLGLLSQSTLHAEGSVSISVAPATLSTSVTAQMFSPTSELTPRSAGNDISLDASSIQFALGTQYIREFSGNYRLIFALTGGYGKHKKTLTLSTMDDQKADAGSYTLETGAFMDISVGAGTWFGDWMPSMHAGVSFGKIKQSVTPKAIENEDKDEAQSFSKWRPGFFFQLGLTKAFGDSKSWYALMCYKRTSYASTRSTWKTELGDGLGSSVTADGIANAITPTVHSLHFGIARRF